MNLRMMFDLNNNMRKRLIMSLSVGIALDIAVFGCSAKPNVLCQLLIIVFLLAIIAVIIDDFAFVRNKWKSNRPRALPPLVLALLCLGLTIPCNLGGHIIRKQIFISRLPEYETVIQMIEKGEIAVGPKLCGIKIPQTYAHLAYLTVAEKNSNGVLMVVFFDGGGFPAKHSGYMFNSQEPIAEGTHRWPFQEKICSHWYRIRG